MEDSNKAAKNKCISVPIQYMPSVEWFAMVLSFREVYFNKEEIYDKRHPCNRCTVATAQGAQVLTIPIIGGRDQKKPLSGILIVQNNKWQREHLHAIKTAYGKAPFFLYYFDAIAEVISSPYEYLYELNRNLILTIAQQLHIPLNIIENAPADAMKMENLETEMKIDYYQVFQSKTGFISNCSVIDLLFNQGPDSIAILKGAIIS